MPFRKCEVPLYVLYVCTVHVRICSMFSKKSLPFPVFLQSLPSLPLGACVVKLCPGVAVGLQAPLVLATGADDHVLGELSYSRLFNLKYSGLESQTTGTM